MARNWLVGALLFGAVALGGVNSGGEKKPIGGDKAGIPQLPERPAILEAKAKEATPKDDELRKLMIARYNIALQEVQKRVDKDHKFAVNFVAGGTDQSLRRLFDAEYALAENGQERVAACANYLALAKYLEEILTIMIASGGAPRDSAGFETCRYLRADAEVRLFEAKRQAGAR